MVEKPREDSSSLNATVMKARGRIKDHKYAGCGMSRTVRREGAGDGGRLEYLVILFLGSVARPAASPPQGLRGAWQ